MALLQYPECLYCDSHIAACQMLHTASLSATDISGTIGSAGSYGQVTEQLMLQPSPVLGPTQNWQLWGSLLIWVRAACKNEVYIASKFQRGLLGIVRGSGGQMEQIILHTGDISWHAPDR